MARSLKAFIVLLTGWFFLHTIFIVIDGLTDEPGKSEIGIILGNKVNEDGTLSERLSMRVDKGIELYNSQLIDLIIVSGGKGIEGYYEGDKMAEYLIAHGIPENKIIIDNEGITTEATAKNLRKMNLNPESITVVSQYYHITRTKLAFHNEGFTNVKGAHARYFEWRDVYSIVREFFGYYKYLLRH